MSEQREGGTVTSLEEVFLSREFGRACARRGLTDSRFEDLGEASPLEEVFLSENFGRPETVAARRSQTILPEPVDPDDAVVTPLHPTWETTRYRAIAAVSGVAAAALVVAGVASGGGHTGRPTVSAQGARVSARAQQGGGVPGELSQAPPVPSAAAPVATTAAQSGTTGGVPLQTRAVRRQWPRPRLRRSSPHRRGRAWRPHRCRRAVLLRPVGAAMAAVLPRRRCRRHPLIRWRRSGRVSAARCRGWAPP